MKLKKENKGITLVALVLTIIVLLILAGISIVQLKGNGLFENAKIAKEKTQEEQKKEDKTLSDYESKIGQYIDGTRNVSENNYSTEEKVIGTWIDGKPLYRKVITNLKSPSQKDVWKDIYVESNADMLMVEKLLIYYSDDKILELNYYSGAGILYAINKNAIQLYIYTNELAYGNKDLLLIVNYTKTTDSGTNN